MCPIKGSHKWIINAERHIKTFNEANVTAKNANNTHIIFIYVTLRERENKHFTPLIPLLAQIPPLLLPAHAWGAWRCDLCVFSVVFVCCHLSQISSWAPFLIFAALWICPQSSMTSSPIGSAFSDEGSDWSLTLSIKETRAGVLLHSTFALHSPNQPFSFMFTISAY